VILYHPNGNAFVLGPATWRSALELAKSVGWRPSGTLPPPADLEQPPALWHGGYEPAAGQQVSRPDALALAGALRRVLAEDPHLPRPLHLLAEFCGGGGFLICASPGITDSLASLVEQVGTAPVIPVAPPHSAPAQGSASGAQQSGFRP
jgi:hypothetical protein